MVQPTKTEESTTTSLSACWVIWGVSIICQTLAQTAGSLKCIYIDLFVYVDIHICAWETVVSGLIQRRVYAEFDWNNLRASAKPST